MYMHFISSLNQNLLSLTKCVHQQKLVNISMIDAVKQHNVTFSNTVRTLRKQQLKLLLQAVQEMCSSTTV